MPRLGKIEFQNNLEQRTKAFAVAVFKLLDALPKKNSTKVVGLQLGKSASSIGANYREANRSESNDDFIHKLSISVKEANESCYWFEVLVDLYPEHAMIKTLAAEGAELRNLFQSILTSAKRNARSQNRKS